MSDKASIKELNRQIRQKNGAFGVIYFFLLTLIISAFASISIIFYSSLLNLFFLLLIIIPSLFAFEFLLMNKDDFEVLSFKNFFSCFGQYFSERYSGSFRVWMGILIRIIVELISAIVFGSIIILLMYNNNSFGFKEVYDTTREMLRNQSTIESVINYLNGHESTLQAFVTCTCIIPFAFGIFAFYHHIYTNSISLFLRRDFDRCPGRYISLLNKRFISSNRWKMFKIDIKYNWYVYLISIAMFALGSYLGSRIEMRYSTVFVFGYIFFIISNYFFFGLIQYNHKEACYEYFKDDYKEFDKHLQKELIQGLMNNFSNQVRSLNLDVKNMNNEEEEDTKKDSDES